jgi:hypothetical protein
MLFAPPPPLAETSQPTPIAAYRGAAVWSTAAQNSKTFTLTLADASGVRALPVTQAARPVEASIGRGPDGKPLIVFGTCSGSLCEIDSLNPATGARRVLGTTNRPAVSPSVWGDRVAWIEHRKGDDRVYTARIGHRGVKRVPTPKRAALFELTLRGRQLALSLVSGRTADAAAVRLQELDGSRARTLRAVTVGEADRSYVGLSFDGAGLYFAQICAGDPSGCPGHGIAFRYRAGKFATAPVPTDLAGFAYSAGSAYWVEENFGQCMDDAGQDAPCAIEKGPLSFRP